SIFHLKFEILNFAFPRLWLAVFLVLRLAADSLPLVLHDARLNDRRALLRPKLAARDHDWRLLSHALTFRTANGARSRIGRFPHCFSTASSPAVARGAYPRFSRSG